MKIPRLVLAGVALMLGACLGALRPAAAAPAPLAPPIAGAPADLPAGVSAGEYLARAADCIACHTAPGGTEFAGGRAFTLPFGTIYASNLTPDPQTGIGGWTDQQFLRAVRDGVGPHGHLYPAMPYTSYTALSRADVLAIKQYLFALAPVHQAPPANALRFPFNQRWGMAFWNLVFFHPGRFAPDPAQSAPVNRGAYLASALGHCGECHTPRNLAFAMRSRQYLAGTVTQGWKAYNTTSDRAYGIGGWTDQQLAAFLHDGHAPGRSTAAGPMAEVVEYSTTHLTPSDLAAMIAYLRVVSPASGTDRATITLHPATLVAADAVLPGAATPPELARGQALFAGDCAGCHGWTGAGRQSTYAALAGSHAVNDPDGHALTQILLQGSRITIDGRARAMPGFAGAYSDADLAAVANYVLWYFGQKDGKVTPASVAAERATP